MSMAFFSVFPVGAQYIYLLTECLNSIFNRPEDLPQFC